MQIGDVVIPVPGHIIRCSTHTYSHAIIASIEPYVMVSSEGDMAWYHQKSENFIALCQASASIVKIAKDRWAID